VFASTDQGIDWSVICAATLMTSAPVLGAFLLFQRQFVQSFVQRGDPVADAGLARPPRGGVAWRRCGRHAPEADPALANAPGGLRLGFPTFR
jgi:hypothetical protein